MIFHTRSLWFAFASASLLTGCANPTGSGAKREVGIVEWVLGTWAATTVSVARTSSTTGGAPVISAPDEVQAGVPFQAVITTFGPDLCWRADGATTQVKGNLAVVVPYDITTASEDTACGDAITRLPRTVSLTIATPGQATLRVEGRKLMATDPNSATLTSVEKQILVR